MLTWNTKTNFEDQEATEFFVGLDDLEALENNNYQYIFDGVEKKWFQEFGNQEILQVYQEITSNLFVGNYVGDLFTNFNDLRKNNFFSRWFLIAITNNETDLRVTNYVENTEQPEPIVKYIKSISLLRADDPIAIQLNNFFSLSSFPLATEEMIKKSLEIDKKFRNKPHKLNIYNVGQGSLCSVASENNIPLIYFDMGGGWKFNRNTYPNTKDLCFTVAKTIIISHWDWDHLETARRYSHINWEQFNGKNWIVPYQNITSSYIKLACKMYTTGNLLIWPTNLTSISFGGGKIILCNGPDKNHSGLALIVESPNNSIKNVLHPADAAYRYIPTIEDFKFDGIAATHHGANFDINNSPIPSSYKGNIAYSHGNRYGHPTPFSITEHSNNGWTNKKETIHGDISFTTSNAFLNVPCHNNCNLNIIQTF